LDHLDDFDVVELEGLGSLIPSSMSPESGSLFSVRNRLSEGDIVVDLKDCCNGSAIWAPDDKRCRIAIAIICGVPFSVVVHATSGYLESARDRLPRVENDCRIERGHI